MSSERAEHLDIPEKWKAIAPPGSYGEALVWLALVAEQKGMKGLWETTGGGIMQNKRFLSDGVGWAVCLCSVVFPQKGEWQERSTYDHRRIDLISIREDRDGSFIWACSDRQIPENVLTVFKEALSEAACRVTVRIFGQTVWENKAQLEFEEKMAKE